MLRFSFMPIGTAHLSALGAALLAILVAGDARAQFGGIFGGAPRPPGTIQTPGGTEIVQEPDDEDVPDLPQGGRVLPSPQRTAPAPSSAQPTRPGAPPPASVQQGQPLPPPPGAPVQTAPAPTSPAQPLPGTAAAPNAAPGQPPLAGLPPGQRQPRGTAAPAGLQPGDEIVSEPPAVKIPNKAAMFSGLDKITGRIIKFDAAIGETVQFGALRVTPRVCYTRPTTEAANTDAFIEVEEITLQGEVKKLFTGWMYAASPGLHAVEHPIYDIWLTDCKGPENTVASAPPEAPKPPPPAPKPPAQKRAPTAQQQRPLPGPSTLPTPFPTTR